MVFSSKEKGSIVNEMITIFFAAMAFVMLISAVFGPVFGGNPVLILAVIVGAPILYAVVGYLIGLFYVVFLMPSYLKWYFFDIPMDD